MENRVKLAIMSILLIMSPMPIGLFFLFQQDPLLYVIGLLYGTSWISVNVQHGWVDIGPKGFYGFIRFNFLDLIFIIASVVVFFVSLVYVTKTIFNIKIKHKPL